MLMGFGDGDLFKDGEACLFDAVTESTFLDEVTNIRHARAVVMMFVRMFVVMMGMFVIMMMFMFMIVRLGVLFFYITLAVQRNPHFQRMNTALENRFRFQFPAIHRQRTQRLAQFNQRHAAIQQRTKRHVSSNSSKTIKISNFHKSRGNGLRAVER